jgi:predicted GNAT family acetyltransferase
MLGDKAAVDVLMQHLAPAAKPVISKTQRLFAVSADDLGPFTNPTLRLAVEADLDQLVPMAAAQVREVMDRDPMSLDPMGFADRVKMRVKSKRTYVLEDKDKRLVFKIDIGSRCPHGAELEGLYTVPDQRRLHHATLSLGQISRHLLSSLPRLTLRVDDNSAQLAGLARKVGYLAGRAQRVVLLAP